MAQRKRESPSNQNLYSKTTLSKDENTEGLCAASLVHEHLPVVTRSLHLYAGQEFITRIVIGARRAHYISRSTFYYLARRGHFDWSCVNHRVVRSDSAVVVRHTGRNFPQPLPTGRWQYYAITDISRAMHSCKVSHKWTSFLYAVVICSGPRKYEIRRD